ncbi:MAG: rRNA maturation RNase YbeY [Synergistales bacterium]
MKLAVQIDDESDALQESGIMSPEYGRLEEIWREYLEEKYPHLASSETVSVSLKFCSPMTIRELNSRYRSLDEPTDVLSFPMWEENGVFTPPAGWTETPLGDIVICPEIVRSASEQENRNPSSDFLLILMHGFLHLMAWDHDTEEREADMFSEQEKLLRRYQEKV